jgi:hypothetical protein
MFPVAQALVEYYRSGRSTHQRFGQYYINNHWTRGIPWPELFYETDTAKAIQMITELDEQENENGTNDD